MHVSRSTSARPSSRRSRASRNVVPIPNRSSSAPRSIETTTAASFAVAQSDPLGAGGSSLLPEPLEEPCRSDRGVRVLEDPRQLLRLVAAVEAEAEPAARADVRRDEE